MLGTLGIGSLTSARSNLVQERAGRITLLDRDADDPAAARLDRIAADDLIGCPVGALDQHVRLKRANHLSRGILAEHRDGVDTRERRDELGTLALRGYWSAFSLVAADGFVGVHADDQRVAERPRLLQVADVPGMDQVENAVGKDDLPAGLA